MDQTYTSNLEAQ